MSAGHTPGPWVVCIEDGDDRAFTIFAEDQLEGGRIDGGCRDNAIAAAGLNHENFEANAHLIAAAPELLAALTMMRDADDDCRRDGLPTMPHAARVKIDAAIEKAAGETT